MESPNPIPVGFVVKKTARICARIVQWLFQGRCPERSAKRTNLRRGPSPSADASREAEWNSSRRLRFLLNSRSLAELACDQRKLREHHFGIRLPQRFGS